MGSLLFGGLLQASSLYLMDTVGVEAAADSHAARADAEDEEEEFDPEAIYDADGKGWMTKHLLLGASRFASTRPTLCGDRAAAQRRAGFRPARTGRSCTTTAAPTS